MDSEWLWRVPNLSEDLSGGLSRVFGPSKLSGGLSGEFVREFVPGFWALKAVRRVVRGLSGESSFQGHGLRLLRGGGGEAHCRGTYPRRELVPLW